MAARASVSLHLEQAAEAEGKVGGGETGHDIHRYDARGHILEGKEVAPGQPSQRLVFSIAKRIFILSII